MTSVLLVGTGHVGVRAARQLADTPEVGRILIASGDAARAEGLARSIGPRAEAVERFPRTTAVAAVALATRSAEAQRWVRSAMEAGIPTASVGTDGFAGASGRAAAATVVTGCALAPGLSDVLARHASGMLDEVEEVHVARVGSAGPACVDAVRVARREVPGEWREGSWSTDRSFGPELLWFPEPVGARECQLVRPGVATAVATVPGVRHVTSRLGAPPTTRRLRLGVRRDPVDEGWGAVRVEVIGARGEARESVVYGLVDRTDVVAAVVLAVTAASLAGAAEGVVPLAGVHTLGEVVQPVPFLTELGRRGVKAAVFEGAGRH